MYGSSVQVRFGIVIQHASENPDVKSLRQEAMHDGDNMPYSRCHDDVGLFQQ